MQSVYISFLMRKDKLVKYFRELQIFKDDIRFPAEVSVSTTMYIHSAILLISVHYVATSPDHSCMLQYPPALYCTCTCISNVMCMILL